MRILYGKRGYEEVNMKGHDGWHGLEHEGGYALEYDQRMRRDMSEKICESVSKRREDKTKVMKRI